jgi:serine/threonine protein kinase
MEQRSDLFSLGSVLYSMCTGRPPFRAETTYGVMRRIIDDQPKPIREINPDIPEWLCGIINRLISKQASDRYESVAELLEACLAHTQQPTSVPLPESLSTFGDRYRIPPIAKWLASAAAAFSVIALTVLIVVELNKGKLTIEIRHEDIMKARKGESVTRVVYYPRAELQARAIIGLEALVSWKMPKRRPPCLSVGRTTTGSSRRLTLISNARSKDWLKFSPTVAGTICQRSKTP